MVFLCAKYRVSKERWYGVEEEEGEWVELAESIIRVEDVLASASHANPTGMGIVVTGHF